MTLKIERRGSADETKIIISGSITIHNSDSLEKEIDQLRSKNIVIDLNNCDYISSAGLRILIKAYKALTAENLNLALINMPPNLYSVFEITGLSNLFHIKIKPREIKIDKSQLISSGACGECYRLDAETIVKLYFEGVDPSIAEKEKKYAKSAFILGIPTAISYDVVSCGNRAGVVYEMLEAELFSKIIKKNPSNIKEHAAKLANIAKNIHSIKGDKDIFPNIKENFRLYIDQMNFFLSTKDIKFLQSKLSSIPDSDQCVHFDLHTSNIMLKHDEPLIIDLGDFSLGSYLFDIGLIDMIYGFPHLNISEQVTSVPSDLGKELRDHFIKEYFSDKSSDEFDFFQNNRYFLASLRAIYTITFLPKMREQLSHTIKDFLLPKMRL